MDEAVKRVLFLDDMDARLRWATKNLGDNLTLVVTAEDAIYELRQTDEFDVVYLDHDLGGETYVDPRRPDTGSGVVRWIVANKPKIGEVVVHSLNTPAANYMVQDLREAGYAASYIPFTTLYAAHQP
jgi:CheY-like chemotaxis protein